MNQIGRNFLMANFPFHVYLAGPFFDAMQIAIMDNVKRIVQDAQLRVFDPREHCPRIIDLPQCQRTPELMAQILDANCEGILSSFAVLACIDDRDTGTAFELGYAYANGVPALTFSAKGYGANVMIAQSTNGHLQSVMDVAAFFTREDVLKAFLAQRDIPNINSTLPAVE